MIEEKHDPEPGEEVTWSSQSRGCETTKTGRVEAVVPAGEAADALLPEGTKPSHIKYGQSVSQFDRVLVAVPAGKDGRITHYYAPRSSCFN